MANKLRTEGNEGNEGSKTSLIDGFFEIRAVGIRSMIARGTLVTTLGQVYD
jgi:hypothetical protein